MNDLGQVHWPGMVNVYNQKCVCMCVLNAKSNILHSHIPPKKRKYTASLKESKKNTEV